VRRWDYSAPASLQKVLGQVLDSRFGDRADDLRLMTAELQKRSIGVLEVAATAMYIREDAGPTTDERVWQEVAERKAHLEQHFGEARTLLADWDRRGLSTDRPEQ